MPTILGTLGDDTLHGTDAADAMRLYAGLDRAWGLGGHDTLDGGSGNDTLKGGADDDLLFGRCGQRPAQRRDRRRHGLRRRWLGPAGGDYGADSLYGGNDSDSLFGSAGRDRLDGGSGDDTLVGDGNPDRLIGGTGDDVLDGGHGNDRLWGDGPRRRPQRRPWPRIGDDVAVFAGVRAGYRIETVDGITIITDLDPTATRAPTGSRASSGRGSATGRRLASARHPVCSSHRASTAATGFVTHGVNAGDASGSSVSSAGDVNGDGIDDLIIGAPVRRAARFPYGNSLLYGTSYVVFGSTSGFAASMAVDPRRQQRLRAQRGDPYDESCWSVGGGGDVNGDRTRRPDQSGRQSLLRTASFPGAATLCSAPPPASRRA
ncbi:MAG: hypothetical protein U1E14_18580 [Geminicoccaceae bacterium]